jgi:hypothetical protein
MFNFYNSHLGQGFKVMKVSTATYEARMADVFAKVRDVVRRYKVWVAITVLVTLVGVGITMTLKPYYQGAVRLQIDPKQNPDAQPGRGAGPAGDRGDRNRSLGDQLTGNGARLLRG